MGALRLVGAAACVLSVAAVLAAGAVTDRQSRTVALPPGRVLAIDVTVGSIRIEGADRGDAAITIERHAPTTEALGRLPIQIDESDNAVRLRLVQPDGGTDPALRADVALRVPREATIDAVHLTEGRLEIAQFSGRLRADVRRGPITGRDVSGVLRLEAGIGSVTIERARLSPAGLLRLRAFNGDVRLTLLERPTDARIMALALNGSVRSDIPLTVRDTWGPRWAETTLGKGEPVISLDVVTGAVDLRSP